MDLQNQDLLDSVDDDLADALDFEDDDDDDDNNHREMVIDDGEEYDNQEDADHQMITPTNLEVKSQYKNLTEQDGNKKNLNHYNSLK